ncbi:uncharacterized protein [Battus philenor]|uniref:uncharacterized protein n=1 Tax=Battus philenor TaxID=42288 RepID=UPI0035CF3DDF
MKIPFNLLLGPLLKPHMKYFHAFCQYPTFYISLPYTYFYGTIGFFVNACHLIQNFGKVSENTHDTDAKAVRDRLIRHDLKIIAASMGIVQHLCLLVGCFTKNPALFLPHMIAHLVMVVAKTLGAVLLLTKINLKSIIRLRQIITALALMTFNWCQEFCVFTQYLCICDL